MFKKFSFKAKILILILILIILPVGGLAYWSYTINLKSNAAISAMSQIKIRAVEVYANYGTYEMLNCNDAQMFPLCQEILELTGKMPVIKFSGSKYCAYTSIPDGKYYYIDSRGKSERVDFSPEEIDFCSGLTLASFDSQKAEKEIERKSIEENVTIVSPTSWQKFHSLEKINIIWKGPIELSNEEVDVYLAGYSRKGEPLFPKESTDFIENTWGYPIQKGILFSTKGAQFEVDGYGIDWAIPVGIHDWFESSPNSFKIFVLSKEPEIKKWSKPFVIEGDEEDGKNEEPFLDVTYPDGGEILQRGKDVVIKWNQKNLEGVRADIHLLARDEEEKVVFLKGESSCFFVEDCSLLLIKGDVRVEEQEFVWKVPENIFDEFNKTPTYYQIQINNPEEICDDTEHTCFYVQSKNYFRIK